MTHTRTINNIPRRVQCTRGGVTLDDQTQNHTRNIIRSHVIIVIVVVLALLDARLPPKGLVRAGWVHDLCDDLPLDAEDRPHGPSEDLDAFEEEHTNPARGHAPKDREGPHEAQEEVEDAQHHMQGLGARDEERLAHRAHGGLRAATRAPLLAGVLAAEVGVAEETPVHVHIPNKAICGLENRR